MRMICNFDAKDVKNMRFSESGFRKKSKIIMVLCILLGCGSLILFIPQIREFIINLGEKFLGRQLEKSFWHKKLILSEIYLIIWDCFFITAFACFTICKYPVFSKSIKGIFNIRNEIQSVLDSKKMLAGIIFVFFVLVGFRLFYINQKKSFHLDEILSIGISNRNEYGFWGKEYKRDYEYTIKELKDISFWDNSSLKDSLTDIFNLHQTTRDPPHTNFYYSIFRLWFTGVKTSNLKYIIWRGCILNLLFFAVSFFFMMLLLKRFTDSPFVISLCLLIAFLNPASLSLTLFLRSYELDQTFVIIFTYFIVCLSQAMKNYETIETKKNFVIGVIILTLTMLDAYFNMIFIGIYGLLIICFCITKKNYNLLRFYVFMFISSVLVAKVLYFGFGNLGADAPNILMSNIKTKRIVSKEIGFIKNVVSNSKFFLFYCVIIVITTIINFCVTIKQKKFEILSIIPIVNLVTFFAIAYLAPVQYPRYVAPLFSAFSVCFVFNTKNKWENSLMVLVVSLILVFSLFSFNGKYPIEHIDDADISLFKEIQETKLPIIVRTNNFSFCAEFIPYLNDNSKIIFISDFLELYKYQSYLPFVFINLKVNQSAFDEAGDFSIKKLTPLQYHDVYLIDNTDDVL